MMATFLQFMLPGMPSIYYADEAGMEGYKDPFNRRPYPWGNEDAQLLAHYRTLGKLRKEYAALRLGDIHFTVACDQRLAFERSYGDSTLRVYVNRGYENWEIPRGEMLMGHNLYSVQTHSVMLSPMGFVILEEKHG